MGHFPCILLYEVSSKYVRLIQFHRSRDCTPQSIPFLIRPSAHFFFFSFCRRMKPSSLGTSASIWPIFDPRMMDDECGESEV
jgi:hypothetical protein